MVTIFPLFSLFNLILVINCIPIERDDLMLEIRVLQNPDLFGGDMLGIDIKSNEASYFNAEPDMNKLWPMGTIPYMIDGNLAGVRSLIVAAMDQYHQNTCIRFVERTNQYDYIHISKENGCYSFVGRTGGRQLVSLGAGCHSMGTIIHELGHAVGFYHEHQRSDRDDYIDIFKQNISPNLDDQFNKLSPTQNRLLVGFDFNSVMLYGPLTFSRDGKSITMAPNKQHQNETMLEVFQKYGLSKLDIQGIHKLYQC